MSDLEKPNLLDDDFMSMSDDDIGGADDYLSDADLLEQELASVGAPADEDEVDEAASVAPVGYEEPNSDADDFESATPEDDHADAAQAPHEENIPEWLPGTLEAIAFLSTEPVTAAKVRELLGEEGENVSSNVIRRAMRELVAKWQQGRPVATGIVLVEIGGAIAFRTSPEHGRFLRQMNTAKPQRLSRAALETLAIVAYRQPLTRPQIDEIRGVDSSGAVRALLDKRLLRILGKADDVGRPLLYGTTKTFLDFFGLATLRDLPTLKEFHELQGDDINPDLLAEAMEEGIALPHGSVVMDLFEPSKVGKLVSETTADESEEALDVLESALGHAVATAKRLEDPNAPMTAEAKAEWRARQQDETQADETDEDWPADDPPASAAHFAEPASEELESTLDNETQSIEFEEDSEFSIDPDADVENGVDGDEFSG